MRVDALLLPKNDRDVLIDAVDEAAEPPVPERMIPGLSIESCRALLVGLVWPLLLDDA